MKRRAPPDKRLSATDIAPRARTHSLRIASCHPDGSEGAFANYDTPITGRCSMSNRPGVTVVVLETVLRWSEDSRTLQRIANVYISG